MKSKRKHRKKNKPDKSLGVHNGHIDTLVNILLQHQDHIESIETEVEYELGEVDIWIKYIYPMEEYVEVKSNDKDKARCKARNQTLRWTGYMYRFDKRIQYVGTYWTPTYSTIMALNGRPIQDNSRNMFDLGSVIYQLYGKNGNNKIR